MSNDKDEKVCKYIERCMKHIKVLPTDEVERENTLSSYITKTGKKCNTLIKFYLADLYMKKSSRTPQETDKSKEILTEFLADINTKFGEIEETSELSQYYGDAHKWLGLIYKESKDMKESEKNFCLSARVNNIDGTIEYASLLENMGQTTIACGVWKGLLKILLSKKKPSNEDDRSNLIRVTGMASYRLGMIYLNSCQYDEARKCLELSQKFGNAASTDALKKIPAPDPFAKKSTQSPPYSQYPKKMYPIHSTPSVSVSHSKESHAHILLSMSNPSKHTPSFLNKRIPVPKIQKKRKAEEDTNENSKKSKTDSEDLQEEYVDMQHYYQKIVDITREHRQYIIEDVSKKILDVIARTAVEGIFYTHYDLKNDISEKQYSFTKDILENIRGIGFEVEMSSEYVLYVKWGN